jgi:hypothetical protein
MAPEPKALFRFGGAAFIVSGLLFLTRDIVEYTMGAPPSNGVDILAWVESRKLALSLVSEVLFFAAISLVPAVIALYHSLATTDRVKAATGCGIIATAIPVTAMALIVHGRLVYPVYGLRVSSPAIAEFTVAVFYGAMHAVGLLLAVATFVLSLAMRRGVYGTRIAYLGFATAVLDVVGSYPDAIGPVATLACRVAFAAWFVALGSRLYRLRQLPETPAQRITVPAEHAHIADPSLRSG